MTDRKTFKFSVASDLLRELGERLVGRHHVALGELIKNSYDADAENCVVRLSANQIVVEDDGHGMTPEEFDKLWMRIGSTHKVDRRFSPEKERQLTGSKGVGRLAAQFLANKIKIETTAKARTETTLQVDIDWRVAQNIGDLTSYEAEYRDDIPARFYPGNKPHGMRICLDELKHDWTAEDAQNLGIEVWMLRSPLAYLAPGRANDDFDIILRADDNKIETSFDRILDEVLDSQKAHISGRLENGLTERAAHIQVAFSPGYGATEPEVVSETISVPVGQEEHKSALDKATFEIYIFRAQGRQRAGIFVQDLRDYLAKYGGVHVYDQSFRLPHYAGERDHDWLSIGVDHARRLSASELLPKHLQVDRMMLDLPQTRRILGFVEISTSHEAARARQFSSYEVKPLAINIARDRLEDNEAFQQLRQLVRWSLDYYASRYRVRSLRQLERLRPTEAATSKLHRLQLVIEEHADSMSPEGYAAITKEVKDYVGAVDAEAAYQQGTAALLAPLATAGMGALAITHELQREIAEVQSIAERLRDLGLGNDLPELNALAQRLSDWGARTEALHEIFLPLIAEEHREKSRSFVAREVIEETFRSMSPLMPGVEVEYREHKEGVRLPDGTLAEWSALFQNLMANSWNAMLDSPMARVLVEVGAGPRRSKWVRISDTGCGLAMAPHSATALFDPFERALEVSSERQSLMLGGRGLGLTIVRMIGRRRGAEVQFLEPVADYATTVQVRW